MSEESLQHLWSDKIIRQLSKLIDRRKSDIETYEKQIDKIRNGVLPTIERDKMNRFTWMCNTCGKPAGRNTFPHLIPLASESVCKECEKTSDFDLMEIANESKKGNS